MFVCFVIHIRRKEILINYLSWYNRHVFIQENKNWNLGFTETTTVITDRLFVTHFIRRYICEKLFLRTSKAPISNYWDNMQIYVLSYEKYLCTGQNRTWNIVHCVKSAFWPERDSMFWNKLVECGVPCCIPEVVFWVWDVSFKQWLVANMMIYRSTTWNRAVKMQMRSDESKRRHFYYS